MFDTVVPHANAGSDGLSAVGTSKAGGVASRRDEECCRVCRNEPRKQ